MLYNTDYGMAKNPLGKIMPPDGAGYDIEQNLKGGLTYEDVYGPYGIMDTNFGLGDGIQTTGDYDHIMPPVPPAPPAPGPAPALAPATPEPEAVPASEPAETPAPTVIQTLVPPTTQIFVGEPTVLPPVPAVPADQIAPPGNGIATRPEEKVMKWSVPILILAAIAIAYYSTRGN